MGEGLAGCLAFPTRPGPRAEGLEGPPQAEPHVPGLGEKSRERAIWAPSCLPGLSQAPLGLSPAAPQARSPLVTWVCARVSVSVCASVRVPGSVSLSLCVPLSRSASLHPTLPSCRHPGPVSPWTHSLEGWDTGQGPHSHGPSPPALLPEAGAQTRPSGPHQQGRGQALHPITNLSKQSGQLGARPPSTRRQHRHPILQFSSPVFGAEGLFGVRDTESVSTRNPWKEPVPELGTIISPTFQKQKPRTMLPLKTRKRKNPCLPPSKPLSPPASPAKPQDRPGEPWVLPTGGEGGLAASAPPDSHTAWPSRQPSVIRFGLSASKAAHTFPGR